MLLLCLCVGTANNCGGVCSWGKLKGEGGEGRRFAGEEKKRQRVEEDGIISFPPLPSPPAISAGSLPFFPLP